MLPGTPRKFLTELFLFVVVYLTELYSYTEDCEFVHTQCSYEELSKAHGKTSGFVFSIDFYEG